MNKIHDYDLYDQDFEEWRRLGMEAFGLVDTSLSTKTENIPKEEK